jgi:hypothetical protein
VLRLLQYYPAPSSKAIYDKLCEVLLKILSETQVATDVHICAHMHTRTHVHAHNRTQMHANAHEVLPKILSEVQVAKDVHICAHMHTHAHACRCT